MVLALLIVALLLAIAGGFLGELLELAAWLVLILVLIGAAIGVTLYLGYQRLKKKIS